MVVPVAALAGVSALVLFLSAMGLFSLMSISVSRRTREIGVRVALGANPRHVLARIVAHAMVLMGSGVAAGGGLVLLAVALGGGPTGRPADDVVSFAAWIGGDIRGDAGRGTAGLRRARAARAQDQSDRRPQRRLNGGVVAPQVSLRFASCIPCRWVALPR